MGRLSLESHSSIQLFPHRIIRFSTILPYVWMRSSSKTYLTGVRKPKYLGTDDTMINVGLMTKLYHVVVHNLNEARKARDRNKKGKTPKELEKLKIGDNVLIRDHTSKAFQPKYKDFCIVGLLGKNQVEIKDKHGHTTKVHRRDVKQIPMTEKLCQLYEEEQIGKVREGRKTVPSSKMPDLGWDIAETQLQEDCNQGKAQESPENNNPHTTVPLQVMITIAIIITTLLENITAYIQEIPQAMRNAVQAIKTMTRNISRNRLFQKIKKSYKTAVLAVNLATNMTDCASRTIQPQTTNRNAPNIPGIRKLSDEYDGSYQSPTSRPHNDIYN